MYFHIDGDRSGDTIWFERPQPEIGSEGDVPARRVGEILVDLILLGIVTSVLGRYLAATRVAAFVR